MSKYPWSSSRQQLREELQATWMVYEPAKAGTPFTEQHLEEANERYVLHGRGFGRLPRKAKK